MHCKIARLKSCDIPKGIANTAATVIPTAVGILV